MSDKSQQTEKATPRRLDKARREGQFPAARQFVAAAQFLAFTAIVSRWGEAWIEQVRESTRFLLLRAFAPDLQIAECVRITGDLLVRMFLPMVMAGGALVIITLATQMAITRFGLSVEKLTPKF